MAETNQDWESILTKLLKDASECINVFEELKIGRTRSEWTSDWVVGDRAKINPERFLSYMKKFKEEVKNLLSICITLSGKVKSGKKMELRYQENVKSNCQLDYFKEGTDASINKQFKKFSISIYDGKEAKEQTCKLKTTGMVVGGTVAGGAVGGAGVGAVVASTGAATLGLVASGLIIPFGIGLLIGSIGAIVHHNVHSSGRKRGVDYQTMQLLYDYFHGYELLSNLETLSSKMKQLSENVDMQIETYKLEFGTHRQVIEQKNAGKELAKATKLYFKTLQSETEQLKSTETDMSEEEKSGLAARAAVRSCKTFLKKLDYSDSQADEFIKELQN